VSELRFDELRGEQVVYAIHRQDRTFLPDREHCPLDPTKPGGPETEIPFAAFDIAVFDNRFPAFQAPGGAAEVVVYSDRHDGSFGGLGAAHAERLMWVWRHRYAELGAREDVDYVMIFENRGVEVGVTLHHPHGQIYAFPFVPPRAAKMLDVAREHRERTGECVACVALAEEKADGSRVVVAGEHFTAYVPYAGRWPFDVNIVPNRHLPDLPALTDAERDELAAIGKDCVQRLDRLFDVPMPYIGSWYQAPARVDREVAHLRWQLAALRRAPGKLKYLAGTESGGGAFMNDIRPERAAEMLRGE
jgi:UDPglucose--hexose-1-phosphate uridylyltransferase